MTRGPSRHVERRLVRGDAGAAVGAARARGVPRAAGVRRGAAGLDRRGRHPADDRGAAVDRAARSRTGSASKSRGCSGRWPPTRGATLVASVFSVDPRRQPGRLQAARAADHRPAHLPPVPRPARAARRRRHHHDRRAQRHVGHRPVPDPQLRQPRAAAAGHARAVHDLLGAADAGRVRRGRRA